MAFYHPFLFLYLSLLFTSVTSTFTSTTIIHIASLKSPVATITPFKPSINITTTSAASASSYWLEEITHQGLAPFNPNVTLYQVFRNVKDFGAKGDGITDDTAAINKAISFGGRCKPGVCQSTTTTPAVVYFPAGTYLISSSIIDYYITQIIGNPSDLPILKATARFKGYGLIDGDTYGANGLDFGPTNLFYRQIRNLVFDLTGIPSNSSAYGAHWPTAQATSLQNCVFKMSDAVGTQHQGLFIEGGSGGFMNDLIFNGGKTGAVFGNQQFTVRNLTFNNAVTAIDQTWDWGWTYLGIKINNCTTGLNMSSGGSSGQAVASVTLIDSSFTDTDVAIITAYNSSSKPEAAGSVILDNISLTNVPVAIQESQNTVLAGKSNGSMTISGWGEGNEYIPNGPTRFEGSIVTFPRSESLSPGGTFYARSKPQYEDCPLSEFVSVRTTGATGDGVSDDTFALNAIFAFAAVANKIVYIDSGIYKVTSTVHIPSGSRIVGESYPVIMGSGPFFTDIVHPQPVIQVGIPLETGIVEWSDTIISTQGYMGGAILIKWNLASPANSPSGLWDVHTRIGGFAGSDLQLDRCPTTPNNTGIILECRAAFMSMHITEHASGLYLENNWFWVADHDIEDPDLSQISIYAGRGLYCESKVGVIWLIGTAVEHHTLYQYQFDNTRDIFAGQIQTETAYYQPNPNALYPFPALTEWNDPDFTSICGNSTGGNCAEGWGLRIIDSECVYVYGAGMYSFFSNYNTSCSDQGNGEACQARIFSLEGNNSNIGIYNLNTVGVTNMITVDGKDIAKYEDNVAGFVDHVAVFRSE
ncbi:glycoside hydrolase family 55 protein [Sclerotinia borealis F-4128]|uniref:Glycoside hydrolase family 55 protein n=1 Tax=Sclerotinia borealis (strain F-4128) TaxID=1432307 RepID=W9C9K3_SCLBF|nr:glycoside hydrolase family 55 protein [Sclerotinia borealis F-4128]